jgi:hypothetical protein
MKIAIYFSEKLILFLFRLCNVGSPHPSAAIMTMILWWLKQKPHWGAAVPEALCRSSIIMPPREQQY